MQEIRFGLYFIRLVLFCTILEHLDKSHFEEQIDTLLFTSIYSLTNASLSVWARAAQHIYWGPPCLLFCLADSSLFYIVFLLPLLKHLVWRTVRGKATYSELFKYRFSLTDDFEHIKWAIKTKLSCQNDKKNRKAKTN